MGPGALVGIFPTLMLTLMGIGRQKLPPMFICIKSLKLMAVAGDLSEEYTHQAVKYPKTPHLPFSPGKIVWICTLEHTPLAEGGGGDLILLKLYPRLVGFDQY